MKILITILLACISVTVAAQDYKIEGSSVKINKTILFKNGSDVLQPNSEMGLAIIKKYLDDKPYISTLRIEAHIAAESNTAQELSEKRALAICRKLVSMGVDCKRLVAVGFGNTKPISTSPGDSNTRIEFINAALRGHAIGGMPLDGGGKVAGNCCN